MNTHPYTSQRHWKHLSTLLKVYWCNKLHNEFTTVYHDFFLNLVTDIWITTQQLRTTSLDSVLNYRILAVLFSPVP